MIWAFFPVRDVLNSDIMICLRIDINLILTTRHFSYLLLACLVTCFVCHLSIFLTSLDGECASASVWDPYVQNYVQSCDVDKKWIKVTFLPFCSTFF